VSSGAARFAALEQLPFADRRQWHVQNHRMMQVSELATADQEPRGAEPSLPGADPPPARRLVDEAISGFGAADGHEYLLHSQ
jgi:hypothetical protein